MRISKRQAEENRARVIDESVRLFQERGLDGVSVADLMGAAGLTHGGFYNHFASKAELQADVCAKAFDRANALLAQVADAGTADAPASGGSAGSGASSGRAQALRTYIERYLSGRARDAEGARCPMVAFAADVSRQGEGVQKAYAAGLRTYVETLQRALPGRAEAGTCAQARAETEISGKRAEALLLLSSLVGALSLARSIADADPALSDEILSTTRASLVESNTGGR